MVDKETRKAALDFLDPQKPEAGPLEVYHKLSGAHKRSLAELASQVKKAKTPKGRRTATDGLRLGLESMGFKDEWIRKVLPRSRKGK